MHIIERVSSPSLAWENQILSWEIIKAIVGIPVHISYIAETMGGVAMGVHVRPMVAIKVMKQ